MSHALSAAYSMHAQVMNMIHLGNPANHHTTTLHDQIEGLKAGIGLALERSRQLHERCQPPDGSDFDYVMVVLSQTLLNLKECSAS